MVSTGNVDPEGGWELILFISEASVAVGDGQVTWWDRAPGLGVTSKSEGQFVTVGGVLSTTPFIREQSKLSVSSILEIKYI